MNRRMGQRWGLTLGLMVSIVPSAIAAEPERSIDVPFLAESFSLAQAEDRKAEADRLFAEAVQLWRTSQPQAALDNLQQALLIYRELGDLSGEGKTLNLLGLVYDNLGDYRKALKYCEQALAITREVGDLNGQAKSLNGLGIAHASIGQYRRAIDFYQQSLSIYRDLGDRQGEAFPLNNLGATYNSLGEYQQALEFLQQSLAIFQDIGDRQGESDSLGNLGIAYNYLGQYQKAIEFYQQSLAINQEIGDRQGEAISLNSLGDGYNSLGQFQQAINFLQQSLEISREIGDVKNEANSLINLGSAHYSLGQYQKSIMFYQQSVEINREIGNRNGEGNSLGGLGNAYYNLGQYQKAIEFYHQSLAINREIVNRNGEATSLSNLGNTYLSLGQYQKALEFNQQSLAINREIGDRNGEAYSLQNLGTAYYSLKKYERAINFYSRSLEVAREIGVPNVEINSLIGLGNAYGSLGTYQKAIEFHQQSLEIAQETGDLEAEANSFYNLGNTFFELGVTLPNKGDFAVAEQHLLAAIELQETLRSNLINDEDKISIFDTQTHSYSLLQQVLIAQNKIETALEISERGRARAFVELLAKRLHGDADTEFVPPEPATLADIQQAARTQNATLVEYSLVSDELLYIWVISPDGNIAFRSINLAEKTGGLPLEELVDTARFSMGVRSRSAIEIVPREENLAASTSYLQQLHQLLIAPIADLLPTDPEAHIIFIPHSELFLVPFPALNDPDGKYLLEKHTILTAPSIQVLELTQRQKRAGGAGGEVLVIGNPTMPTVPFLQEDGKFEEITLLPLSGAETEALDIADFLNASPLLGDAATETVVKQQIARAHSIHFATHGLLEYGDPQQTGSRDLPGAIALAPGNGEDGLLTSSEILDLDLQANLVVLSACDTGRGRITGDGVVGLSRAFISAGVPSIVVSLWAVPDAPTAELMTEFYRQWQTTGNKAQALRQAMLTTMQTHPEPRNWAAFTLIGESQ